VKARAVRKGPLLPDRTLGPATKEWPYGPVRSRAIETGTAEVPVEAASGRDTDSGSGPAATSGPAEGRGPETPANRVGMNPADFVPRAGVDYAWVVDYAEKQLAETFAVYRRLDDKAASILNYLGAGTGLLTLGSLSSAVLDKASLLVLIACVPAAAAGLLAMFWAARARMTKPLSHPPAPTDLAAVVDWYAAQGEPSPDRARAASLRNLGRCLAANDAASEAKADLVNRSMRVFVGAVALLMLPVAVVVCEKAWPTGPKPLQVEIIKDK
jgi:hypothetical protein